MGKILIMLTILIKEEVFGVSQHQSTKIQLEKNAISLAELIQIKAINAAKTHNKAVEAKEVKHHAWLNEEERILNKAVIEKQTERYQKLVQAQVVDEEKISYEALAGFQSNAYFVIVDGKQRLDLEEVLELSEDSEVQFIRLTSLAGG